MVHILQNKKKKKDFFSDCKRLGPQRAETY